MIATRLSPGIAMLAQLVVDGLLGAVLLCMLFDLAADRVCAWEDAQWEADVERDDFGTPIDWPPPIDDAPLRIRAIGYSLMAVAVPCLLLICATNSLRRITRPS